MTNKPMFSVERDLVERINNPFGDPHDKFNAVQELRALLDKPAVELEPYGWVQTAGQCINQITQEWDVVEGWAEKGYLWKPLYTEPPAAKQQGEPVALNVWEGAMPESNGRSNFTVILHTGDLTEGICVYRSEYPDRARYEADCFRHLIGDPEFQEKPFILDYDTDKHSGYVRPDTQQPAPVAVVMPDRKCPSEYRDSSYTQTCMAGEYNRALDEVARLNGVKP